MKTNRYSIHVFLILTFFMSAITSCGQAITNSPAWPDPVNLTAVIDTAGATELSGLHWNPVFKRLYVVGDNGQLSVLQLDEKKKSFQLVGRTFNLGGPEGITQVNYAINEFYTIDEKKYEIRKFSHSSDFVEVKLQHTWNLKADPALMTDTGNDGPEGIVFIPDRYLEAVGFESSDTYEKYTSRKGMGGLIFVAHQKKGFIWVFDVNPDKDDDYAFVGKYKTSRNESCDLSFDRSTGLLYILHNTDGNFIEVTDLSTTQKGKFITKSEYAVPNPAGNINIEGLAIAPKFVDPDNVFVWLCRDVSTDENISWQKSCLWFFRPFKSEGNCVKGWNTYKDIRKK